MSDAQISIGMDPRKVIESLQELSVKSKSLAKDIEESLGKEAPKHIKELEQAAENGTTKIATFFRNLSTKVRADLKTAFDATGVMAGMKMGKDIAEGVKQVFEMERAFDRLNTRLHLSNKEMNDFKNNLGKKVSATGQKLEDIIPGVETAASRGGVKDAGQLANIGEALGKAKAITGEGSGEISEGVIKLMRDQNIKVTDKSFKEMLDAVEGTRTAGAFKSANEAAGAMHAISGDLSPKQMKDMGLNSRSLGGLAAMSSKSGEGGTDIMGHILHMATQAGGKDLLNSILGPIFKNGKLDAKALQNINPNRLGQFSEQTLSEATGTNQAELARWIQALKSGNDDFEKVVNGANETADQFGVATDNFASKFDQFKENVKEAGREVGESLSAFAGDMLKGNFSNINKDLSHVVATGMKNAGPLAGAGALTIGAGLLMGGGLNGILKRIPGGGMAKGLLGGEAAKAAGVTPVYVTNPNDMKPDSAMGLGGAEELIGGKKGSVAGALAKGGMKIVAGVGIGYEIGKVMGDALVEAGVADMIANAIGGGGDIDKTNKENGDYLAQRTEQSRSKYNSQHGTNLDPAQFAAMLTKAHTDALNAHSKNQPTTFTNPSAVKGRR